MFDGMDAGQTVTALKSISPENIIAWDEADVRHIVHFLDADEKVAIAAADRGRLAHLSQSSHDDDNDAATLRRKNDSARNFANAVGELSPSLEARRHHDRQIAEKIGDRLFDFIDKTLAPNASRNSAERATKETSGWKR